MTNKVTFGSMKAWLRLTTMATICAGMVFNAFGAHAYDHYENRRPESERRDYERHGPEYDGPWNFESHHGWRFERGPGVWSPYYAWWWVGGVWYSA